MREVLVADDGDDDGAGHRAHHQHVVVQLAVVRFPLRLQRSEADASLRVIGAAEVDLAALNLANA